MICQSEGCDSPVVQYFIQRDQTYQTKKVCKKCEHLLRRYGITDPMRREMIAQQGGECQCCGELLDSEGAGSSNKAHVDHCHTQGHIRSILCGRCNTTIGLVKEDRTILLKMIDYLDEYC